MSVSMLYDTVNADFMKALNVVMAISPLRPEILMLGFKRLSRYIRPRFV